MLKWIAGLLAVTAFLFGPAPAEARGNRPKLTPEEAFKKLDKNGDGKLSLTEFVGRTKGARMEKREFVFKAKDANNDGFLTLEEFTTRIKGKKRAR